MVFLLNFCTFIAVKNSIMAKPIKETPILRGKDAIKFVEQMKVVESARPKGTETARIRENFARLQAIAKF